ncbi:hypothetical protein C497_02017 [Halalkalicoccus jeotgali B3]|uniref:Uncharacterized protein n=1 Tax=Halalkalicoccus jeotgali (strain DSM 18796 / CECT 7217 / JCM 14584 / KCTC 4019 / B3) TaxID=795797 RepID=D8JBN6_HALJB|nr:hypothetical protein HacjB3_16696 [Halalkalicoccus jeotgali B3]ELY40820.1 hypothetical protein C497_02017 [Halalkalicoccus jeotgali B3]
MIREIVILVEIRGFGRIEVLARENVVESSWPLIASIFGYPTILIIPVPVDLPVGVSEVILRQFNDDATLSFDFTFVTPPDSYVTVLALLFW